MRITIADDHPVILMGLRALLNGHGEAYQVIQEAHNGEELLRLLAEQPCDLLITDYSMPDENGSGDGLPMLRHVRRDYPALPIIVLTMVHNLTIIRGMLAGGVQGVVEKATLTKELLLAVQAVSNGRIYLSERLRAAQVATSSGHPLPALGEGIALSTRQAEIVRLYASGLTVTQIAEKVHRSVKTVSQQKNDAMRKLGLTSNSELYEYARAHGLIS